MSSSDASLATAKACDGVLVQLGAFGCSARQSFTVTPGDEVVLNGLWPVADAGKLRVSLIRSGVVLTLTPTELNENVDWSSDVRVRLPKSLEQGEWRMIVSSKTDSTQDEVPIVIRVENKDGV